MTEANPNPGRYPPVGPISQRLSANSYLEEKKIPQIFESLLACLMLECPDDHMTYLNQKLDQIKEIGPENIAWDTFVAHLRSDKNRGQPENSPESDLPHAEQDAGSFVYSESLEPPVGDGISQLFQLTDPMLTDSQTKGANLSEASGSIVLEANGTNVLEASGTNVLEASGTNVLEASAANVSEASGTNVLEANRTNVSEASVTNVLEASGTNVLEASGTNVLEASAANVSEASGTNVFEANRTNVSEASVTKLLEASAANVLEASGTNVLEASGTNVSKPSGANDSEIELERNAE